MALVTAAAEEASGGSDTRSSGDGGSDSWWETQGYAGRWKCEVVIWLTLPCLYRLVMAAEESFLRLFATPSEFGPPVVPKKM